MSSYEGHRSPQALRSSLVTDLVRSIVENSNARTSPRANVHV
jgi:hypothetical protein